MFGMRKSGMRKTFYAKNGFSSLRTSTNYIYESRKRAEYAMIWFMQTMH